MTFYCPFSCSLSLIKYFHKPWNTLMPQIQFPWDKEYRALGKNHINYLLMFIIFSSYTKKPFTWHASHSVEVEKKIFAESAHTHDRYDDEKRRRNNAWKEDDEKINEIKGIPWNIYHHYFMCGFFLCWRHRFLIAFYVFFLLHLYVSQSNS